MGKGHARRLLELLCQRQCLLESGPAVEELCELLSVELGDAVTVVADPEQGRIIIAPVTEPLPGLRPGFLDRVDGLIDRYRPALETLAQE
jgi:hypothetical protein